MKKLIGFVLGFSVLLALQSPANALPIPIVNGGFEALQGIPFVFGDIPGWTLSGPGLGGTWNINVAGTEAELSAIEGSTYFNSKGDSIPVFWNVPAPQGDQVAYLSSAVPGAGLVTLTQTLSAVLQPDMLYALTGYVGQPIGFGNTQDPPTYWTVALLAGSNVLASLSNTGPEGTFVRFEVDYDSTGSPSLGELLTIQLSSNQPQSEFDDIQLNAIAPVPTPPGIVLFAVGIAGMIYVRMRRLGRPFRIAV